MIAERKYKSLTPQLRAAAVKKVAELSTEVSSRWKAIVLIAEALEVHPNTLRNWVNADPEMAATRRVDTSRLEQEHRVQLAAATELINELSDHLHGRRQ